MEADITAIVAIIKSATGAGGPLAIAAALVYGLVKILRLGLVQLVLGKLLGPKAQWANWPKWVCMLVVCAVAGIGSALTAVATGSGWLPAIIAGIVAAAAAMGTDSAISTLKPALPDSKPNP